MLSALRGHVANVPVIVTKIAITHFLGVRRRVMGRHVYALTPVVFPVPLKPITMVILLHFLVLSPLSRLLPR